MKPARKQLAKPLSVVPRGEVTDGQVTDVSEQGTAWVRTADGTTVEAHVPQHVDVRWLRAAVALAPVECALARTPRRAVLWCILPGPEHAEVVVDVEIAAERLRLSARSGLEVRSGRASLRLEQDGKVELRGKDVLSRASHSNRIKGGVIRLN